MAANKFSGFCPQQECVAHLEQLRRKRFWAAFVQWLANARGTELVALEQQLRHSDRRYSSVALNREVQHRVARPAA
jgi:hypothetical protein